MTKHKARYVPKELQTIINLKTSSTSGTSGTPGPSGKTPEQYQADVSVYLAARAFQQSALTARAEIASRMNTQFAGKRNFADSLGYPVDPSYADLYNLYKRDGMAGRIVDCVSDETWRKAPIITDGDMSSDNPADIENNQFLKDFDDLVKDHDLLTLFSDADAVCGYSKYSIIFLGLPGNFDQPAKKNGTLNYLNVFDESQAQILSYDKDTTSKRYGKPVTYNIQFKSGSQTVHWTRVIHIREGRGNDPVNGTPRLYKVIDRLYDLTKVVGGGSEAFWLAVFRGLAFLARDDASHFPQPGTAEFEQMQDDIEEYMHGLNRYMQLSGVDVQDLGSSTVDGSGQFNVLIAVIAGIAQVPKRILIGSEMGQLASSQDDKNFADSIAGRQTRFAEPRILRAFIDRCIDIGIIAEPTAPRYGVTWQSLFELNPLEKSQQAVNAANAVSTITGGVPEYAMTIEDFMRMYLDYILPEAIDDNQSQDDQQDQNQNDQGDGTNVDPDAAGDGQQSDPADQSSQ